MSVRVSEYAFEDAIEAALLRYGPDEVPAVPGAVAETAPPYGDPDMRPGGYRRRGSEDYDRALCLLPRDILDFVQATQPKVWQRLSQHHGAEVRERFLKRLSSEIERRGALVAVGREHEETQGGACARFPRRCRGGGVRGRDARGRARECDPRRDGVAGTASQSLDLRLHRDTEAEDPGAAPEP